MPPTPLYGFGSPTEVILSKEISNLHPMALTLVNERWRDLTPSLANGESVQRLMGDLNSQNKISELLEMVAENCSHSRAGCRKPFGIFTFAGRQPD